MKFRRSPPDPDEPRQHEGCGCRANARAVITSLELAAQACLDGACHGLVTGPTHKASLNAGGIPYTGTTELLAAMTGCDVVMMLARPGLRVALVTTHLPLRDVADALTITVR